MVKLASAGVTAHVRLRITGGGVLDAFYLFFPVSVIGDVACAIRDHLCSYGGVRSSCSELHSSDRMNSSIRSGLEPLRHFHYTILTIHVRVSTPLLYGPPPRDAIGQRKPSRHDQIVTPDPRHRGRQVCELACQLRPGPDTGHLAGKIGNFVHPLIQEERSMCSSADR